MMLSIKNLSFGYTNRPNALKNISLDIEKKDIFFLIGANGAGKSTLLKNILGLCQPDEGSILFDNKPMNQENRLELLHSIGILLENASFYGHLTVQENLDIVSMYYNTPNHSLDDLLEILSLKSVLSTQAAALSTGYKQRLGLAMALAHHPQIVFLDEPTNGLDPQNIINFRKTITSLNQTLGVTFFITTHILQEVERLATKVGIIQYGQIIDIFKIQELSTLCKQYSTNENRLTTLEDYYLFKYLEHDTITENRMD